MAIELSSYVPHQEPQRLLLAGDGDLVQRLSPEHKQPGHGHVSVPDSVHERSDPTAVSAAWDVATSGRKRDKVTRSSGVLRVLLAVLQTSGAAASKWRTTGGSPSLQATWNEFQPSLFCSAGSAPRRSSSWTTPRFLRVQAIISGVLREEATEEIRCWRSKNNTLSINGEDSFRGRYRDLYLLLSPGLWRSGSF
ncbi:hypothetical protein EYF80_044136 [Liparis tanakae]|uniref:Uncharacterized protein n=1 Tax=Liparis tanakae TaxID=230148 RepID=A0A4Z2FXR1_9TELE|nr:hypothetical protein EYF80_044136 [Liparis tanakae]